MRVAVVVPCFRTSRHICDVLQRIGPEVSRIYVVDDCCPERTGDVVTRQCDDPRVLVIRHEHNQGVGGAVMTGYQRATADHMDIVVKVDGDGQMDPSLIPAFIQPIIDGRADYTKGNRFFDLSGVASMPVVRLVGNAALSFMAKLSTGYWNIFDPTNGYTAIDVRILHRLPYHKIERRYFFETDLLFRLSTLRAVVVDVPMESVYGQEQSGLRPIRVLPTFFWKHSRNLACRLFYTYVLRDMTIATFELMIGVGMLLFGVVFGAIAWSQSARQGTPAPLGTIMLSALPTLMGLQFILAFLAYDIASVPTRPIARTLPPAGSTRSHG